MDEHGWDAGQRRGSRAICSDRDPLCLHAFDEEAWRGAPGSFVTHQSGPKENRANCRGTHFREPDVCSVFCV